MSIATFCLLSFTWLCCGPAWADSGNAEARASIVINATPKVVWRAIHDERFHDPDIAYNKVLEHSADGDLVEQKFTGIPILGSVIAVTKQTEIPLQRIDYVLVSSDKFKRLEGSWSLVAGANGRQTTLYLSSYLDVGVPFSGLFIRNAAQGKLNRRLTNVKLVAERDQAQLSAAGKEDL